MEIKKRPEDWSSSGSGMVFMRAGTYSKNHKVMWPKFEDFVDLVFVKTIELQSLLFISIVKFENLACVMDFARYIAKWKVPALGGKENNGY